MGQRNQQLKMFRGDNLARYLHRIADYCFQSFFPGQRILYPSFQSTRDLQAAVTLQTPIVQVDQINVVPCIGLNNCSI